MVDFTGSWDHSLQLGSAGLLDGTALLGVVVVCHVPQVGSAEELAEVVADHVPHVGSAEELLEVVADHVPQVGSAELDVVEELAASQSPQVEPLEPALVVRVEDGT